MPSGARRLNRCAPGETAETNFSISNPYFSLNHLAAIGMFTSYPHPGYAILGRLRNLGVSLISVQPQAGGDPGSPDE